jgi:hypothetical protein
MGARLGQSSQLLYLSTLPKLAHTYRAFLSALHAWAPWGGLPVRSLRAQGAGSQGQGGWRVAHCHCSLSFTPSSLVRALVALCVHA